MGEDADVAVFEVDVLPADRGRLSEPKSAPDPQDCRAFRDRAPEPQPGSLSFLCGRDTQRRATWFRRADRVPGIRLEDARVRVARTRLVRLGLIAQDGLDAEVLLLPGAVIARV